MKNADDLLTRRFLDLSMKSDAQHIYTHTRFLTPLEQSAFLSACRDFPSASYLYGGSESAIRKIAVFGTEEDLGYPFEDPIRILHIRPKSAKYGEELSHRDYLGSLMALGIERELTGDIVVRGKEAWIYVMDSIADFLCESLTAVRHTSVICEEASGDVPELSPVFETLSANVASERIDLIASGAAGISRDAAKKLLADEKIFVNGRVVSSAGQRIREGDELVIRGYGKYIYDGVSSESRKGRANIKLRKYV